MDFIVIARLIKSNPLMITTVQVMNKFKRLDLVDRVPKELWMEVHNIVQEAVIKPSPKKEMKKST